MGSGQLNRTRALGTVSWEERTIESVEFIRKGGCKFFEHGFPFLPVIIKFINVYVRKSQGGSESPGNRSVTGGQRLSLRAERSNLQAWGIAGGTGILPVILIDRRDA